MAKTASPGTPPVAILGTPLKSSPADPAPPPGPPAPPTPAIENQPGLTPPTVALQVPATGHGAGNNTSYHGPTSALFDETAVPESCGHRQHAPHANNSGTNGPSTYWVQKSLFAEAASQRHLETTNLAAGKLDFDGVDPDLGMHLLRLHWNRHHSFLITYRPAFMRDMACGGPYFSRLLLNAIFFGASKFSNRLEVRRDPNDVRTAGWLFRERVRQLLGSALDRSDITTIQALLVMTSSLFALGDERSAAWLYAGTAFRMIIDLGMHVDGLGKTSGLSKEDVEIRRRVFWGAFVVDKIQSLYQGRPVSLQEIETSVPLAFHDEYEELENWQPFAYYTDADLQRLHTDLETWKNELPPHLKFDPSSNGQTKPPPHVLMRHAPYHISYATYVAATIHVRIAAQPGFVTKAKKALAICLMVFDENSGTNWAVKRARAVIGGLMHRMDVRVEAADASTTTTNMTARVKDAEALMALATTSTNVNNGSVYREIFRVEYLVVKEMLP
ncbi:hypothetical protein SBRCBS47491_009941 [Sporothrix bragantina]|uniref:Xylanolytic transcriptional activator regulatory domain-containing protein n=1 Tax=Sporothrix bragantina TaxID=671064 RepID=A0ABP0CYX0_9PEZI